ncbi:hypothetical protein E6H34_02925 [Candidatus Bathyarchaeota archaeon]|nr:MAG: hypothetical protein E6H34_02925 [Candidatus Bathyarchaeota archaeon]
MQIRQTRFDTKRITLTASLAALYIIPRTIPLDRLIGISGSITFSGIITPVLGVFLAPSYGILAVFLGTMIAAFIPGSAGTLKFGGLDFLGGALNVALISLLIRGRKTEATLMYVATLGLFVIDPNTQIFVGTNLPDLPPPFQWLRPPSPPVPYLWLHLVALAVLLSPLTRNLRDSFVFGARKDLAKAVLVVAFIGTMIEHLTGGILFASVAGAGALRFWPAIFLVYPFERAIIVLGAVLVCTPLLLGSRDLIARYRLQET